MKSILQLLSSILVFAALASQAQTPVYLQENSVTGQSVNVPVTFTPAQLVGITYPNITLGAGGVTLTPTNGYVATNLLTGVYVVTFAGYTRSLIVVVPDLWVTNYSGITFPLNLADRRWLINPPPGLIMLTNNPTLFDTNGAAQTALTTATNFTAIWADPAGAAAAVNAYYQGSSVSVNSGSTWAFNNLIVNGTVFGTGSGTWTANPNGTFFARTNEAWVFSDQYGALPASTNMALKTSIPSTNGATFFGTNVVTSLTVSGPGSVTLTTSPTGITAAVAVNAQTNSTLTQLSTGSGASLSNIPFSGVSGLGTAATMSSNTVIALSQNPTNTAAFAALAQNNGGNLTGLTAANLVGTLPQATLPGAVVTNNATGLTLGGSFAGSGLGLTNLITTFMAALGDSYTAYFGGTTNQWVDQLATTLSNIVGGIAYTNAAASGSWVEIEVSNQVNAVVASWKGKSGNKWAAGTGGINDLSSGGLHNNGQQNSNQVFLAITNIIATVHNNGGKILWGIQSMFGNASVSSQTYGTNWLCLCQMLRQLTNNSPNYPSNVIPDYLVDFAAHQDEFNVMGGSTAGHPDVQAQQMFCSLALQSLWNLPAYITPYAQAAHFTMPTVRGTNFAILDGGNGNWVNVLSYGGYLFPVYGHCRSQISPGNQWEWANGSGFMMTLDSNVGNLTTAGGVFGSGGYFPSANLGSIVLTNTLRVIASTPCPTPVSASAFLWNSNGAAYWVTPTHTNYITGP